MEREIFDIVAVVASPAIGRDVKQKKLSLQLLQEATRAEPTRTNRILNAVLDLSDDEQEVLFDLLERTKLASIVRASQTIRNILAALRDAGLIALGDKGYHGYDPTRRHVITPYKGKNKPASQTDANRAHARLRGPGERANAQLKTWRILRKLRSCPRRAGRLAKAIHILQNYELANG